MGDRQGPGGGRPAAGSNVGQISLGGDLRATQHARRLVREILGDSDLDALADDACTLVTELVTNALLHGRPPVELTVEADPGTGARLEVGDTSSVLPLRTRATDDVMTGRGLALVESLAADWGVRRTDAGKVIWVDLRAGTNGAAPDARRDALLAGWPGPEATDATTPGGEQRYTVQLGEVPTDLLLAAKGHVDNLVREFALASTGARAGSTAPVPEPFENLIETVVHRFATAREAIKRQALAAAHAGASHVRLELRMPASAAAAGEAYLQALDQADEYCRAMRLLTLESPPQHKVFRRWYVEELVAQLRRAAVGAPPVEPQTFEQRLLQEIDTVAAAERTAERSARLYALTSTLASAVTPEAVTEAVLREGAETLRASGGAILLATSISTLHLPGAAGYREPVIEHVRAEPADAELPAARALRTGESVWLESLQQRDERFPALAGMEPGTVSLCAVPLAVGGHRLGALRFSFTEARLFDAEERDFVATLAAQTAQALERARLFTQRVDVSRRLQRSLLPPRLPVIPGLQVEAAYHPFGDGMDVGGDFYDVWRCGDGRWGFAIGDASGSGPEAAAMTALVRHTLRALTLGPLALAASLQVLNDALRDARADDDAERFCTVVAGFATVERDRAVLEVASGGHPGPFVARASGEAGVVDLQGTLLGLFEDPHVDRRTLTLAPGDEVVLYTDGVTDARRDGTFFGVEGIAAAVTEARERGVPTARALADAVHRHTRDDTNDDIAVLTLRFTGRGGGG